MLPFIFVDEEELITMDAPFSYSIIELPSLELHEHPSLSLIQ
jgi:hypothetical protein